MKRLSFLLVWAIFLFPSCESTIDMRNWNETPNSDFLTTQLQFPRVRTAFESKKESLKQLLLNHSVYSFKIDLYLRAFKKEEILEVWIKSKTETKYRKLETYDFCKTSGVLGPKRKEGDRQIPEGFYLISHYNPKSNFLLSLKVNYPNKADKILSDSTTPGNDIYIHGGCQTVGCIPITDDKIQEVYLLSVLAKQEGKSIPIHIFPFKMTEKNLNKNLKTFPEHQTLWDSLKIGFDFFENNKTIPKVTVNQSGVYLI